MAAIILRPEPYDPDAKDGDGDGIVQERTPWERPVGTRLLDFSGSEIERGRSLTERPAGLRIVDPTGRDVSYTPSYERQGIAGRSSLSRLGYLSLSERGVANVRSIRGPRVVRAPEKLVSESFDDDVRRGKTVVTPVGQQGMGLVKPKQRRALERQRKIAEKILSKIDDPDERDLMGNVAVNSAYWATTVAESSDSLSDVLDNIWSGREPSGYSPHQVVDEMYAWGGTYAVAVPLMMLKERMNLSRRQVNQVAERMKERFRALKIRAGTMNEGLQKRFGSSMDSVRSAWKARQSAEVRDVEHLADLMEDAVSAGIRTPDKPEPDLVFDDENEIEKVDHEIIGGRPGQAAPTVLGRDHPELQARLEFHRQNPRPTRDSVEQQYIQSRIDELTQGMDDPVQIDRWMKSNYESVVEEIDTPEGREMIDELFWQRQAEWRVARDARIREVTGKEPEEQWGDEEIISLLAKATDVSIESRALAGDSISVAEMAVLRLNQESIAAVTEKIKPSAVVSRKKNPVGKIRSLFRKSKQEPDASDGEIPTPPDVSKEGKALIASVQSIGKEVRAELVRRLLDSDPEVLLLMDELEEERKELVRLYPNIIKDFKAAFQEAEERFVGRKVETWVAPPSDDEDVIVPWGRPSPREVEQWRREWRMLPPQEKIDWIRENGALETAARLAELTAVRDRCMTYTWRADKVKRRISATLRSVVTDLRPMGGDLSLTGIHTRAGREPIAQDLLANISEEEMLETAQAAVDVALEFYPSDMVDAIRRTGNFRIELTDRAFWSSSRGGGPVLGFNPNDPDGQHSVSIHELGHGVAGAVPEVGALERLFLLTRIEEDTEAVDHLKDEICYEDAFFSAYCGRIYGSIDEIVSRSGTEIMSMGMQQLFGIDKINGPKVEPVLPDEGYVDFVLGVLVSGGLSKGQAQSVLKGMKEEEIWEMVNAVMGQSR